MLPVNVRMQLRLVLGDDRAVAVPATLSYSRDLPYAVTATFHTADGDIAWVFGRDLLCAGVETPSGDGDVAVWPSVVDGHEVICLSLSSPTGSALLEAEVAAVEEFLDLAYTAVPAGTEGEHLDLDAELAALLSDDPSPQP